MAVLRCAPAPQQQQQRPRGPRRQQRRGALGAALLAACVTALLAAQGFVGSAPPLAGREHSLVGRRGTDVLERPTTATVVAMGDAISEKEPLRVLVAGGGVGGLALANALVKVPTVQVTVLEKTSAFKRFGGPIQLASNAMTVLRNIDAEMFKHIEEKATFTGNLTNGIKDGIRTEWYAMFDLKNPAKERGMPYTCVVERPDLQQIMLDRLPKGVVRNGAGVTSYRILTASEGGGVIATLEDGQEVHGDVLIGADGIWSAIRATMHQNDQRGENSGAAYSGYTVYAGELHYKAPDNGQVGYKVYIGPNQYFVVTDIGKGRYQWYAFLVKPVGTAESERDLKPIFDVDGCEAGNPAYLRNVFEGWSHEIHDIIRATRNDEIEQRDLYDRPPSVGKPWTDGPVALLGDAIHAMMPNLGQGGCQAMEDAFVISEELTEITSRSDVPAALERYKSRRLVRSAAVQGLSRFASDIIIRGFDTPAKITMDDGIKFENFGYAGIVTRLLQPILPVFFNVQFNFLYSGWQNGFAVDIVAAIGFLLFGGLLLALFSGAASVGFDVGVFAGLGLEGLLTSAEGTSFIEAAQTVAPELENML